MCRFTTPCLLLLGLMMLAGCNDTESESTPAPAAVDDGETTWGRVPFGAGELRVECPPGWSCKPDDEGRLRHKRLAASVSLRRSTATDAASMVKSEQMLRVQQRRILVEEAPHALGLVQETRQQLSGGAESRSWSLLRAIDEQPVVCTGTASTTDYPDLVEDFDTICTSLELPSSPAPPVGSADIPPRGEGEGAPTAGSTHLPPDQGGMPAQPAGGAGVPTAGSTDLPPKQGGMPAQPAGGAPAGGATPALFAELGVALGMTPTELAAAQPELADDGVLALGPWSVRAGFWGAGHALTTLTATAGPEVDADAVVAAAIETWGAPMLLDDGEARAWLDPGAQRQVLIDAPARDRLRVTWRQVTSVDAVLGQTPGRLGFEHEAAPLLGLSRAQLAGHYADLLVGEVADAKLALPPLPEGGITVVELVGDPINQMTVHLDVSRRPSAARDIEVAVEQRLGPLERIDHDGQLAQRGTDRTRTWTLIPGDDGRLTLIVR